MYNFLNLGFEGYKRITAKDLRNARLLSRALESTYFTVLSNIHVPVKKNPLAALGSNNDQPEFYEAGLPVVAFR
jgi:glutamate decarboxylase